ncbi:post-GPI attachment to proteins factor 2-like [Danaus plexippus]|uniref:post-GPI attachment to proteins factor 2-like n=1 Tax=Danaus plexippus TaxID=13037 RepID=UPI002AB247A1|nr:post-GPI attachment to proteins factor 2-like [Danaus plexippus]
MYLPLHNGSERKYIIKIPVKKLSLFTVSLPLLAFIICVLITMYKDFESANNTHCKVPNVFPSISASIGNYEPQRTIWRLAIYSHAPIRFFIIYLRWEYYRSIISQSCAFVVNLAVSLNIIENLTLLGLTHWTSSQNYPLHEICFKTFIAASMFYMFFTCMMLSKYKRRSSQTKLEAYSIKMKWRAFFFNVGSFTFAAYFFLRHNKLCEPYVYSMFGLSEYIVVISNIIFHMTTVYDLKRLFIYFSRSGFVIE